MSADTAARRYGFYATVPLPTPVDFPTTGLGGPATYLYRVRVLAYPEGSHDDSGQPVYDWTPPGWENHEWNLGTDDSGCTWEFRWPQERQYLSRSAAVRRRQLLESFGATVVVERSSRIVWPEPELEAAS